MKELKYLFAAFGVMASSFILQAQPPGFNYTVGLCSGNALGLLGIVEINGMTPGANSWIAAFDETHNLAGSSQLFVDGMTAYINNSQVYQDLNSPAVPCASVDVGINLPEKFYLVVWNSTDGKYYQFPNDGTKTLFEYAADLTLGIYVASFANFTTTWNFTGNGFADLATLPVELLYFRGQPKASDVLLEWATASELNNDYFEVQRSADGRNYEVLGKVQGAGTHSGLLTYDYTDRTARPGINYYRLRQVDYDGAFEYSNIVSVTVSAKENGITLYPNPTSSQVEVGLPAGWPEGNTDILLRDLSGRVVRKLSYANLDAPLRISVEGLPAGYYTLQASNGREVLTERLIVADR
jgi:hypothetical protein